MCVQTKPINLHRLICHLVPICLGSHPSFDFVSVSPFGRSSSVLNGPTMTIISIVLHISPSNSNSQPYGTGLGGFVQGVHKGTKAWPWWLWLKQPSPVHFLDGCAPVAVQSNRIQSCPSRSTFFRPLSVGEQQVT